jgi:hypothetical protein
VYRVWPYNVVDKWVWLYRLGRKSIAGVASLDAISTCFGGQETAMVVYRYDYYLVLLEEREMNVTTLR